MSRRPLAALGISVVVAFTACVRVGTTARHGAVVHSWTRTDTVRIGCYEEPDTLNPVVSEMSFASDVFQLVFDGLIRYDQHGNPVPDLARELPTLTNGGIARDGRTITYHLMPNAHWQDGVPLTAADVIFTWHALMNPANITPTHTGYDRIESIEAPDSHTLRLHFRAPYPPALFLFKDLNQGAILPKHLLERAPNLNRVPFNTAPVGSGPYIFERWSHGSEMRFRANHTYFRGAPQIEHVVLKFIPNQNTLLDELQTHEIDVYLNVPPWQAAQLRGIEGLRLASHSTLHWEHLNFNTKRPPLDERAVRRALAYALDENVIFHSFYRGLGRAAPTHFNPDFPWGDPSIHYYPYDPHRAGALLEAAGWKLAADGYRYRSGTRLSFAISTVAGVKAREAIEVYLQSAWRAIGADVAVKNYQASTLFAPYGAGGLLATGKTDVALFTWETTIPDPDDETFMGPHRVPPHGQNDSFFQDAEIGQLQRQGLSTFDVAKRKAAYVAIQRILIAELPEYVLDWEPEIVASNADLRGPAPAAVGSDLWNIADWSYHT